MLQFNTTDEQKELLSSFLKDLDNRPLPNRNLDQFWATEETVLRRVMLIKNSLNSDREDVLFLGDDDLTSIALTVLFKSTKATVIETDHRLVEFIRSISKINNLPINVIEHNLINPLPKNTFKNFNTILFDPPYTSRALNTWLIRAMEASLGSGSNQSRKRPEFLSKKKYFLCYGYTDKETERGLRTQQIITSLGLIIQEKIRDFNRYQEARSIGSKSDIFLLQPTPQVNIRKLDISRSKFYTGRIKTDQLNTQ